MIEGYGDVYRQGLADWNAIIDGLVKPTFDGVLALPDLGSAVTEARAAALPDPRQSALKRKIAEIRARATASVVCGLILRALRGLHGHHLVILGRRVPLEMFAAQADLVTHEFIAELEGVQPVAGDGAVAQAYHHAAQDRLPVRPAVRRARRGDLAYSMRSPISRMAVASSLAFSGATRVTLV